MRGSKSQLTFADIYRKKLQKLHARHSSLAFTKSATLPDKFQQLNKLYQEMAGFAESLEKDSKTSMAKMKSILLSLPNTYRDGFHNWVDSRGMDVLQLCIVFDKHDIIRLLLEDYGLFPESYSPALNPYVHLAATLGYLECLEVLLTFRPRFYFNATKPQHVVNIPKDFHKRLKIPEGGAKVSKQVNKILRRVDEETMQAEMASATVGPDPSIGSDIFESEIKSLKQQKISASKQRETMRKENAYVPLNADTQVKKQSSSSKLPQGRDCDGNPLPCRPSVRKRKEHVISVYMNYFEDAPDGVVRGAGPAVKVIGTDSIGTQVKKTLPVLEDVRKLNYCSRRLMPSLALAGDSRSNQKSTQVGKSMTQNADSSRDNVSNNARKSITPITNASSLGLGKRIDFGVRTIRKYKNFRLNLNPRRLTFKAHKPPNKTPLTIAAENGHINCVKYILKTIVLKQNPAVNYQDALTLATMARSPESIAVLLTGKYSREDFQSAILTALRGFYPACLVVLLSTEHKERSYLFDGESLFHIFFSQSLNLNYRYEMMPEMTKTLISCKEDVNSRNPSSTHPMYTLISCSFNIEAGRQCLYYLECLKILLSAKANPHYNELRDEIKAFKAHNLAISRPLYQSAIHCVFISANRSTNFFANPYWSKIIMQKFIDCIVVYDKTPRRILNEILFSYMEHVCHLGLDRKILRSLFRYGANPDYKRDGKYAINTFFDEMLPFLTKFEVKTPIDILMDALMFICHSMSQDCLHNAFVIFLDEHLLLTPVQALPVTHRFCYEVNNDLRSPRSLLRLSRLSVWKSLRRNSVNARKLPVHQDILSLIIPY